MPRIPEHPKTAQRSRGPTGKGAKPPADGPAPEEDLRGPRGTVEQASRDIKAGILDDERGDRGHAPDDVPGPREASADRTRGAQARPQGSNKRK
ncbi:MAG TPA: hypothetical protein VF801_02370 [Rhodocyclaceae bacterium]